MKRIRNNNFILRHGLAALFFVLVFGLPWAAPAYAAPAEVDVEIPVTVRFEGEKIPEETFTVELTGDNVAIPLHESATLSADNTQQTVGFHFKLTPGNYQYTIRQNVGTREHVTYSSDVYTYFVGVYNDGRVVQHALENSNTDHKPDAVTFVNTYGTPGPDMVIGDPPVKIQKTIGGSKEPPEPRAFQFTMVPEDPSYPLPEGYDDEVVVTVIGEGEVEIGNIAFTEEGIYRYDVKEKHERVMGYYYDDAVFQVVYTVYRDDAGKLQCDREIIKQGKEPKPVTNCEFENIYGTGIIQKVKTGDPALMVPVTLLFVISTGYIAAALVRRRAREAEEAPKAVE